MSYSYIEAMPIQKNTDSKRHEHMGIVANIVYIYISKGVYSVTVMVDLGLFFSTHPQDPCETATGLGGPRAAAILIPDLGQDLRCSQATAGGERNACS